MGGMAFLGDNEFRIYSTTIDGGTSILGSFKKSLRLNVFQKGRTRPKVVLIVWGVAFQVRRGRQLYKIIKQKAVAISVETWSLKKP